VYRTFIVVVPWQGNVYSWEKGGFAMQSVKQRKHTEKEKRKGEELVIDMHRNTEEKRHVFIVPEM
jgi:hypothetical protein